MRTLSSISGADAYFFVVILDVVPFIIRLKSKIGTPITALHDPIEVYSSTSAYLKTIVDRFPRLLSYLLSVCLVHKALNSTIEKD